MPRADHPRWLAVRVPDESKHSVFGASFLRHARDAGGIGEGGKIHVMFPLVTPKVRKSRAVLLLGFRPQVGATILQIFRVLVESYSGIPFVGSDFRS